MPDVKLGYYLLERVVEEMKGDLDAILEYAKEKLLGDDDAD